MSWKIEYYIMKMWYCDCERKQVNSGFIFLPNPSVMIWMIAHFLQKNKALRLFCFDTEHMQSISYMHMTEESCNNKQANKQNSLCLSVFKIKKVISCNHTQIQWTQFKLKPYTVCCFHLTWHRCVESECLKAGELFASGLLHTVTEDILPGVQL